MKKKTYFKKFKIYNKIENKCLSFIYRISLPIYLKSIIKITLGSYNFDYHEFLITSLILNFLNLINLSPILIRYHC